MVSPRSRTVLLPLSVTLFAIGVVAIALIFALSAAGHQDLPLWLNVAAMLTPIGLITGIVTTVLRTRARS